MKSSVLDSDVTERNHHGPALKKLRPPVADGSVNHIHFESVLHYIP